MKRTSYLILAAALFLFAADGARNEKQQQWPVVGGGPEGMRYSPLDQINRSNVQSLQQAWRFDSGDEYEGSELQCNPIIVDGVL